MVGKIPPAKAGDMGLIPGPRRLHQLQSKYACMPQLLSPCFRACRLQLTEAHMPRAYALQQEKPPHSEACAPE